MNDSTKIDPFGFREYDARWLYPEKINLKGIENLGRGLGSQIINTGSSLSTVIPQPQRTI